jgi:hypothetical protein
VSARTWGFKSPLRHERMFDRVPEVSMRLGFLVSRTRSGSGRGSAEVELRQALLSSDYRGRSEGSRGGSVHDEALPDLLAVDLSMSDEGSGMRPGGRTGAAGPLKLPPRLALALM